MAHAFTSGHHPETKWRFGNGPARRLATSLAPPTCVEMDGPVTYFMFRLAS